MSSSDVDPEREIKRLHVVLEDWFGGIRNDLRPLEESLAPEFTAVTPDGQLHDRAAYFDRLDERRSAVGNVRIQIEELVEQRALYGMHQLTFHKRIVGGAEPDVRQCSAWVRETNRTSTGLQYLHLHETRIPQSEPDDENED